MQVIDICAVVRSGQLPFDAEMTVSYCTLLQTIVTGRYNNAAHPHTESSVVVFLRGLT